MVDVDDSCQFSADTQPKSTGLVWGLAALNLHSSDEPGELLQRLWAMMAAPLTLSWLLLLLICVEGKSLSFYLETLCWCSVHYGPVSVGLSVTRRSSTVTGKRLNVVLNKQCLDSAGTLVFWCIRSLQNLTGVAPYRGTKYRWGGLK